MDDIYHCGRLSLNVVLLGPHIGLVDLIIVADNFCNKAAFLDTSLFGVFGEKMSVVTDKIVSFIGGVESDIAGRGP